MYARRVQREVRELSVEKILVALGDAQPLRRARRRREGRGAGGRGADFGTAALLRTVVTLLGSLVRAGIDHGLLARFSAALHEAVHTPAAVAAAQAR